MASVLTLQEAKEHLRVTHTVEDDKIWGYCLASYDYITNYLNTPAVMSGDSPAVYPDAIKHAARLIVAAYYEQEPVPVGAIDLMYPYRQDIGI